MVNAIIASMALMASAAVASWVGSAVVINMCESEVHLCAVPSSDGVHVENDTTLAASGGTFTQQWTQLGNDGGWSIKLYPADGTMANIMQYEYTYQGDDTIWYDLSDVNGNPWDGNWEITASSASSTCTPKDTAYRYATDDAYGMQSCNADSVITVTLCSGNSDNDGAASSASSSAAAASTAIASSYSSAAASTTPEASSTSSVQAVESVSSSEVSTSAVSTTPVATSEVSLTPTSTEAQTTTFATSTKAASTSDGHAVGPIDTVWFTDVQTITHYATETRHGWKREAATPAAHVHNHAARHPHVRA